MHYFYNTTQHNTCISFNSKGSTETEMTHVVKLYLSSQFISFLFKMASTWRYTLVCLDGDMDISTTD